MGVWASRMWRRVFGSDTECKIVIVGLNNAGKTTILYKLHLGQVVLTQPTIGSNVEEVRHENLTFMVWDLGGQETLRAGWSTYFADTDAIVFVVDSNDQENMVLAKMELFNVVLQEDLRHACLLVLANKQDIQGCRNSGEIAQDLSLHTIRTHEWQIQSCCALTGEGLQEGLTWIATRVREQRKKVALTSATSGAGPPRQQRRRGAGPALFPDLVPLLQLPHNMSMKELQGAWDSVGKAQDWLRNGTNTARLKTRFHRILRAVLNFTELVDAQSRELRAVLAGAPSDVELSGRVVGCFFAQARAAEDMKDLIATSIDSLEVLLKFLHAEEAFMAFYSDDEGLDLFLHSRLREFAQELGNGPRVGFCERAGGYVADASDAEERLSGTVIPELTKMSGQLEQVKKQVLFLGEEDADRVKLLLDFAVDGAQDACLASQKALRGWIGALGEVLDRMECPKVRTANAKDHSAGARAVARPLAAALAAWLAVRGL